MKGCADAGSDRPGGALVVVAVPLVSHSAAAAKPKPKGPGAHPWAERIRDASRYLRARSGSASFAVIDERGRIHGYRRAVQYSSASLVKAMLLVAYLRRGDVKRRRLRDPSGACSGR